MGPLLQLQERDSEADHLRAQQAALPERAALDQLLRQLRQGEAALAQASRQAADARRAQDRLEADLAALEAKATNVSDRLYGRAGVVSSPKELQALQADLEMLNRQKEPLEEKVLQAMEDRESAVDLEARTTAAVEELRAKAAEAEKALAVAEEEVARGVADAEAGRDALRPRVPPSVLAVYDRIRSQSEDGVAAAALVGGVCQGCKLRLSNAEYEAARHATDIVRCEACRRILVLV